MTGSTNRLAAVLLAASPTLQEAFMTSIRIRLAEQRGRTFFEKALAAKRKGEAAPEAPKDLSAGIDVSARLDQQFAFLNEADRLKSVLRATTLCDGSPPRKLRRTLAGTSPFTP